MTLTPEERRRIYEEEKEKIEAGKEQPRAERTSTLDLKPATAGLLCYLGGWVTGIIFLILEQKNRIVRFHAVQSIIVFGFLSVASLAIRPIPFIGTFFGIVIGIFAFILWIVLMIKASQGYYSLPVAGELAEKMLGPAPAPSPDSPDQSSSSPPPPPTPPVAPAIKSPPPRSQRNTDTGRAGRIAASAFAIAFSIAVLIFLNFYHQYIAYYHMETIGGASVWIREPILTSDFSSWLPVVNTAIAFTIIGHAVLLAVDKYILREGTLLVLDLFAILSIAALLIIFPFDFSVFGNNFIAPLDLSVRITMVLVIFGIGIAVLVRLIKIIVNAIRGTATY